MKKKIFIASLIVLFISTVSYAETIYFKNGKKIKGEIVEKASYYVVVKKDGQRRKYFLDLIDRIEDDIVDAAISENIDMDQFMFTQETKVEWILKLMEANGTRGVLRENIDRVIEQAPEERKREIANIFDLDGLMERLIPIFDEHYTEEEIKELVAFYESPIGQKVLAETPLIMKEVMEQTIKYFAERAK